MNEEKIMDFLLKVAAAAGLVMILSVPFVYFHFVFKWW